MSDLASRKHGTNIGPQQCIQAKASSSRSKFERMCGETALARRFFVYVSAVVLCVRKKHYRVMAFNLVFVSNGFNITRIKNHLK